jgi:hypothetical protein
VGGGVDRDKLPASDFVDPERRRFPIVTAGDVTEAVTSYGRAKPRIPFATFKRRLTAIAKRKGFDSALPDEWREGKAAVSDQPSVASLTKAAKALFTPEAIKCQCCDIGLALQVLGGLLGLIDSESMSQAMGEQEGDELEALTEAFERVHEFIAQELQELLAQRAPDAGAQMDQRPEETKMDQAEVTKQIVAAVESYKALLADAMKDFAGKAEVADVVKGLGEVTAAIEAAKASLADVTKRVATLEASPAPGGPVLRPQDLQARGIVAVDKGPSAGPGQAGTVKEVLADIDTQIDAAHDPKHKEALGQLYVTLATKYRA